MFGSNKMVLYNGKKYEVLYNYGNGYIEIREMNSHGKIELVQEQQLEELKEEVEKKAAR